MQKGNEVKKKKRTTPGIRWSSPTQLLVWPSVTYLWESGRDPEFSTGYGRTWLFYVWNLIIKEGDKMSFCGRYRQKRGKVWIEANALHICTRALTHSKV